MSFQLGRAVVLLGLGLGLGLAAAAFGFLEIGFLVVERGFFELVDEAGFAGEPDAADMDDNVESIVQSNPNVFILGAVPAYQWLC